MLAVSTLSVLPTKVYAHEVEVSGDVGGLIHLEPNDNPVAGKPTQVWIALTKRGGEIIPLEQCDCILEVRTKPFRLSSVPIFPTLKPTSAERYRGIPGAEVIFPHIGRYELQLSGKPKAGADFSPFVLNFEVTVATGRG
ncbi:hypothetical protein V2H45_02725 [Tumidithrix elongata RA019]|uniref:Transketolase n=1 Tax=Tumidithrix elongata BACA0141 TaxID=2716417 RepID=A0AAW9PQG2_9CYAN|nr:hypothetical protein [Tumidithrix elongata RA019]